MNHALATRNIPRTSNNKQKRVKLRSWDYHETGKPLVLILNPQAQFNIQLAYSSFYTHIQKPEAEKSWSLFCTKKLETKKWYFLHFTLMNFLVWTIQSTETIILNLFCENIKTKVGYWSGVLLRRQLMERQLITSNVHWKKFVVFLSNLKYV